MRRGYKSVTFTTLTDGETYAWRAWGSDHRSNGVAPTAWCYFTVDKTKPATPTVTAPTNASYTVGTGLNLAVTGAADVAGYVYWVTPTQLVAPAPPVPADGTVSIAAALPDCATAITRNVRWACKAPSGATTLTVAPTDALSTVWVSAYDKAGNQSAAVGRPLYPWRQHRNPRCCGEPRRGTRVAGHADVHPAAEHDPGLQPVDRR
ncbi:hypothetical protein JM654_19815 [Microbacterium oxydans]|nr:hypothetical protein [Microbacterium oxydans]